MAQFTIDTDLIRRLAELLDETGLNGIELGDGPRRVRVARAPAAPAAATAQAAPVVTPAAVGGPEGEAEPPGAPTSPILGTGYVAPEPAAAPFVGVGSVGERGPTLFIHRDMTGM